MRSGPRPGGSAPPGWSGRFLVPLAAGAAALVGLALLVHAGAFTRVDQFSLDHLMPWLVPGQRASSTLASLVVPFGPRTNGWCIALDLWTYPCSVLVSGLTLAVVAAACMRRRQPLLGVALVSAWVAGNAVELLGKHTVRRPALYGNLHGRRVEVRPFLDSFPSGHMIRGLIVAGALALAWPRVRTLAVAWVALVGPFLVLSSAHTVSDVLGGLVVGVALLVSCRWLAADPVLGGRLAAGLDRLGVGGRGRDGPARGRETPA